MLLKYINTLSTYIDFLLKYMYIVHVIEIYGRLIEIHVHVVEIDSPTIEIYNYITAFF